MICESWPKKQFRLYSTCTHIMYMYLLKTFLSYMVCKDFQLLPYLKETWSLHTFFSPFSMMSSMSSSVISLSLEANTWLAPCRIMFSTSSLPSLFALGSTKRPAKTKLQFMSPPQIRSKIYISRNKPSVWYLVVWPRYLSGASFQPSPRFSPPLCSLWWTGTPWPASSDRYDGLDPR